MRTSFAFGFATMSPSAIERLFPSFCSVNFPFFLLREEDERFPTFVLKQTNIIKYILSCYLTLPRADCNVCEKNSSLHDDCRLLYITVEMARVVGLQQQFRLLYVTLSTG